MKNRRGWRSRGVFDLVCRHRDYDKMLHEKVLGQDSALVENCATPEARRLYMMQRAVMRYLHAKAGFMRLKLSGHGVLYAEAELAHNVADLLLAHFHRRYPTFHIALGYDGRTYVADPCGMTTVYDKPVMDVVGALESALPENPKLDELMFGEDVWRRFYDSQQIAERRNTGLMDRMMPHRHRDKDAYETAAERRCHSLSEYV